MSKIMSVFEKLNLVEKVNEELPVSTNENLNSSEEESESNLEEKAMDATEDETAALEDTATETEVYQKSEVNSKHNFEKNMTIEEIYSFYGVENSSINTIFMLGNFINALPENLPYDIKKNSVMNIISASNTDLNKLMMDGEKRLDLLSEFIKNYQGSAVNTIAGYKAEIDKLSNMIKNYNEQIKIKEAKLDEQKYIIKYEAEKINSIINFFSE